MVLGSLVEIVIGYSASSAAHPLRGPVTIAPTIALIGLSLYPFGAEAVGTGPSAG